MIYVCFDLKSRVVGMVTAHSDTPPPDESKFVATKNTMKQAMNPNRFFQMPSEMRVDDGCTGPNPSSTLHPNNSRAVPVSMLTPHSGTYALPLLQQRAEGD